MHMDSISLIKSPIVAELAAFRELFDSALEHRSNALLDRAVEHIRHRSGKMMRPMMVMLVAKLAGGEVRRPTQYAAVALELLHTASLVHDDVVDDSSERRGQLSVNALYNNKVAVLVGDYLLATALVQVALSRNLGIIDVVSRLGCDLADGELLQLSNISDLRLDEQAYFNVIRKKTAALFAACAKSAALSVEASDETVEDMRLFGEYVGMCFQIKDDVFDYFESKEIGKPTGNDMHEGKLTLPAIYALHTVPDAHARELAQRVKQGEATAEEIAWLIGFTKQNGGIDYARAQMDGFRNRALQLLERFPQSDVRRSLETYVDYVIDRVK